jgi:hypothetical protein
MFAVLPHAPHDPAVLVPKLAMSSLTGARQLLPPRASLLDDRTSFVVFSRGGKVHVWHGAGSGGPMREAAAAVAADAARFFFGAAPADVEVVTESGGRDFGDGAFGAVLAAGEEVGGGGGGSEGEPMYSGSFEWIDHPAAPLPDGYVRQPTASDATNNATSNETNNNNNNKAHIVVAAQKEEGQPRQPRATDDTLPNSLNASTSSEGSAGNAAAAPALYQCARAAGGAGGWEWERVKVYDDQDLVDDCFFALVVPAAVFFWVGDEFLVARGLGEVDEGAVVEFARKVRFGDGSNITVSACVEYQGRESEDFFDMYEAGY